MSKGILRRPKYTNLKFYVTKLIQIAYSNFVHTHFKIIMLIYVMTRSESEYQYTNLRSNNQIVLHTRNTSNDHKQT